MLASLFGIISYTIIYSAIVAFTAYGEIIFLGFKSYTRFNKTAGIICP